LKYRLHWLGDPALPLAVSPAVRSFVNGLRRTQLSTRTNPLFELRLPPEYPAAKPSRPAAAGQQLSWASVPFSTCKDRRSTSRGLYLPAPFRLQGLATLLTVYSLRARAGFFSRRRRSWDSPFGAFSIRKVPGAFPPGCTHIPLCSSLFEPPKQ
jgi:hypothetical protein